MGIDLYAEPRRPYKRDCRDCARLLLFVSVSRAEGREEAADGWYLSYLTHVDMEHVESS